MYLDEMDASIYASQGQQRSIVLAMKIGLLELIKKEIGEYPILLLDDVLSELDDVRKTKDVYKRQMHNCAKPPKIYDISTFFMCIITCICCESSYA